MKHNLLIRFLLAVVSPLSLGLPLVWAEVVLQTAVVSRYVDQGLKVSDAALQPAIELSEKNFYGGLWASSPLENRGDPDDFGDELQVYGGYGWALGEKTVADFGLTRYVLDGAEDTLEAYFGVQAELGTVAPAFYIYNDFDLDQFVAEVTATVVAPLEGFPFEVTATVGYVEGLDDYRFWGLDLVYPIELSDSSRLSLGAHYSGNDLGGGVSGSNAHASAAVQFRF